jgi:hypothetical protein
MITLEDIQNMYDGMEANGVNVASDFLYTYFFISKEKLKLEALKTELEQQGFSSITLDEDEDEFLLSASRIEKHNAKSLFELGELFYRLADKYFVEYDGFDLGNPDGESAIASDDYAVAEEFEVADLEKDGLPELVVLNSAFEHFPHKSEFKYLLKFAAGYKISDRSNLPMQKDIKKLDKLEHHAEDILNKSRIENYYVFRTTNNGERDFYIAVADKCGAINALEKFSKKNEISVIVIEDENWKVYYDTLNRLPKED